MSVVSRPTPAVAVLLGIVRVSDHLVALGGLLLTQQLLETDETGEDEGQLTDDQGLEGEKGESAQGQGDESGRLQLQQKKQWKQNLSGLFLLATSCNRDLVT